jgi:hypothetical protein
MVGRDVCDVRRIGKTFSALIWRARELAGRPRWLLAFEIVVTGCVAIMLVVAVERVLAHSSYRSVVGVAVAVAVVGAVAIGDRLVRRRTGRR